MKTGALIFDMVGTMIDSMPYYAQSWIGFERDVPHDEALALIGEKEAIDRKLSAPVFAAVAVCTGHDADALAGAHVVAQASDYHPLTNKNFLESLHA